MTLACWKINMNTRFTCNLDGTPVPLPHTWQRTVGSCHALLALRADWQEQLGEARNDLGFRHVRFHGILCDDIGTVICERRLLRN